jgi:hypothetical protein
VILALLAAAASSGAGTVSVPIEGPVNVEVRTDAASVEVVQGPAGTLAVSTPGEAAARIDVEGAGTRYEVRVDGRRQVRSGRLRVQVPAGSSIDLTTVTGSIESSATLDRARARTMSGRVALRGARQADVETIDGAVQVDGALDGARVHTTAGKVSIEASGPALQAEVETSSGPVEIRGLCGKGCHVDVDSVSGDLRFALDPKSSFDLRFTSHSGRLRDRGSVARGNDAWTDTRWGGGEGRIECETFSADATLAAF